METNECTRSLRYFAISAHSTTGALTCVIYLLNFILTSILTSEITSDGLTLVF